MVELVIRLVFSLAVVLGMLLLLTRLSAKRFRGGTDALIRVLHRQPLSRTSAVAVVTIGSRVLVVGTTEHQVQLLAELDPEELEPVSVPEPVHASAPVAFPEPVSFPEPVAVREPVAVSAAEAEEPAAVWQLATLDELLGAPADAAYAPRHATRNPRTARTAHATQPAQATRATRAARAAEGALAGSLLSAQTWRQAFAAATNRPRDAS